MKLYILHGNLNSLIREELQAQMYDFCITYLEEPLNGSIWEFGSTIWWRVFECDRRIVEKSKIITNLLEKHNYEFKYVSGIQVLFSPNTLFRLKLEGFEQRIITLI